MSMAHKLRNGVLPVVLLGALTVAGLWQTGRGDEPSGNAAAPPPQPGVDPFPEASRVSVAEARRHARVLHSTLHATLQLVHHRYFREDEGMPIPAAVMNQVFAEIEAGQPVRVRWLVVEGQAMNTDHLPQDAFEREAVAALEAGEPAFEQIEAGVFRWAGPITLTNACLKCHVPDRKSTENRTAGLLISMPVLPE